MPFSRGPGDPVEVTVREKEGVTALRSPGYDPAVWVGDEGLSREAKGVLAPHAVDEGREIAVLEGGDLDFRPKMPSVHSPTAPA